MEWIAIGLNGLLFRSYAGRISHAGDGAVVRTVALLCAALAVSGCGLSDQLALGCQCRADAGPQPYAAAAMFGLIGTLVAQSQPETQEWNHRVDDRMHRGTLYQPVKPLTDAGAVDVIRVGEGGPPTSLIMAAKDVGSRPEPVLRTA